VVLGVDLHDRRQVLPAVAQLAVGIVLDDRRAVVGGELDQAPPPLEAERHAGRVLEVRQDVEELGATPQLPLQPIDVEPVVVDRHGQVVRLVGAPGLQRSEVGGRLGQDAIAGVDEETADQVEPLLRARGDHHVRRLHPDPVARHLAHEQLAQRHVALGCGVLQRGLARELEHTLRGQLHLYEGKDVRRRQAAGERDHVRLFGELEQLADRRARHALRALGEALGPEGGRRRAVPASVEDARLGRFDLQGCYRHHDLHERLAVAQASAEWSSIRPANGPHEPTRWTRADPIDQLPCGRSEMGAPRPARGMGRTASSCPSAAP
jgi:hypothetical protein